MDKLDNNVIELLKRYKDLIKDNKFEELYSNLDLDSDESPDVTQLFIDAGVINEVLVNMDIIPDTMFSGLDLNKIILPNNIIKVGNYAFSDCTSLTSVTIPNSVTSISNYAFSYCSSLTSVTIPDSVKEIGEGAFYKCAGMTNVTIGNGVESIGNIAFYECTGLTSITIPDSVTSIGDYAFQGCDGLTSVIIPNKFKPQLNKIFIPKLAKKINFTFI